MMNRQFPIALSLAMSTALWLTTLPGSSAVHAVEINIDPSQRFQTIAGFGACLVSWDDRMTRFYETEEAQAAFANDLRLNIVRCNLWGQGTIGPTDDWRKISYKDPEFAAQDSRTPVFINFIRAVRKINPQVKVIGTVWSPPAWMKESGATTGRRSAAISAAEYVADGQAVDDRVKREYYPHFVKWMVEMAKYYESQGAPLYAISPANEPQFTQTFESCTWTVEDLLTIIVMLGEQLDREGLGHIKIYGMESMTGFNWEGGPNRELIRQIAQNDAARRHLDVFATHGYVDGFTADQGRDSADQFWRLIKDSGKPYWMTEGGTGQHAWPAPIEQGGVAAGLHNSLAAGNVSAWVPWQFAGPGGDGEHALRAVEGPTKKTWIVRQYARYIPAGSLRIAAEPAYGEVNISAFLLPKGRGLTFVVTNHGASPQDVTIALEGSEFRSIHQLHAFRTSAEEDCQALAAIPVTNGRLRAETPPMSVTTYTTAE